MMYEKVQCEYLFELIRSGMFDGEPFENGENADWEKLYKISRSHKIEGILCSGIYKMPEEERPPEKMVKQLEELWQMERGKDAVQKYSLNEILDAFEEAGIDCVPLKGICIKEFYPESSMRTMSDLDLLYRGECEKAKAVLLSKGYQCESEEKRYHDIYWRRPFTKIEMHHHLLDGNFHGTEYYEDVWERKLHLKEGHTSVYEFSWEDYYIFMIVHFAKHMKTGGSGIRSVLDIKVFLDAKKEELDWQYIEEELRKIQLGEFEKQMKDLSEVWFGKKKGSRLSEELTEYIIDSGVYGTMHNYRANRVVEFSGKSKNVKRGKIGSKLNVIFLPLYIIRDQYPYLKKYPFLLPVAWIECIMRTIFKRRDRIVKTIRDTEVDDDSVEKVKRVMDALEI